MDKTRDVKRGGSRFSPAKRQIKQSGRKLFFSSGLDGDAAAGGDLVEKSKKVRDRKLTSSFQDFEEMGSFGSDGEDEIRRPQADESPSTSNKRFKIPKKFFDECNPVYRTSVPRKLRSAMKKRDRESISPPLPDSKKMNHTTNGVLESSKNNVSKKKSKLDMKQGSSDLSLKRVVSGPVTKDEEEVAETLFALAGMFSNSDSSDKSKDMQPLVLPEAGEENSVLELEVQNEIGDLVCPSATAEAPHSSSSVERAPLEMETVNADFGKTCGGLKQPVLDNHKPVLDNHKPHSVESESVPQVNLQTTLLLSEREPTPLRILDKFGGPAQQSMERKPEIALNPVTHFSSPPEQHHLKEVKKNGPALWPGLFPSHSAEIHGHSSMSFAAKSSATPTCAGRSGSAQNNVSSSTEKVSRAAVDGKSWKRCAAHVNISRLIQDLKISEKTEGMPVTQPNQLRPTEEFKQGVHVTANISNGVRNVYNGVLSGDMISCSAIDKNTNDDRSVIHLHKRLHQDQQQAALPSGPYALQKQSFDFLSLSARGGGVEANNNSSKNKVKNGLENSSQLPISYWHSLAQNQTLKPSSLPEGHYSSSAYPDQMSAAAAAQARQQLPSYFGNPFSGTSHTSAPQCSGKQQQLQQQQLQLQQKLQQQQQQQLQQQQLQHQIWAAQMAAQYRTGMSSGAMSLFPIWQNGRQDSSSLVQCTRSIIPPSPSSSSLEIQGGPKYMSISPQQQQCMTITSSLAPAKVRRQHHHQLPSGYDENGGSYMPSQLLCNEQL